MIAVPITAENFEDAISDIKAANKAADVIELRLDFFREMSETVLAELLAECKKPVIVAFRKKNFGTSIEDLERVFLLRKAVDFNAHFIDLDFFSERAFLNDFRQKKNSGVILSYHNFEKTPSLEFLLKIFQKMLGSRIADAVKVVCFANSEKDNETILKFLEIAKESGKPIIAFCMGPKGRKSRIDSIRLGAWLSFASLGNGKESAEGQLSVEELKRELEK